MALQILNLKRNLNAASNELLSAIKNVTKEYEEEQQENERLKKRVKLLETTNKDLEAKVKVGEESKQNLTAVLEVIQPVVKQYKWNMKGAETPKDYSEAIAWEVEIQAEEKIDLEKKLAKREEASWKTKCTKARDDLKEANKIIKKLEKEGEAIAALLQSKMVDFYKKS
jgi:chromosome segregation ATPase